MFENNKDIISVTVEQDGDMKYLNVTTTDMWVQSNEPDYVDGMWVNYSTSH